MSKAEKLDMDSKKRLEKLEEAWGKGSCEGIAVSDLRLLLENFAPLRDLICQIVAPEPSHRPVTQFGETSAYTAAAPEVHTEDAQVLQNSQQAMIDLKACTAQTDKLLKERDDCKQDKKDLRSEIKQLQKQLEQARTKAVPELAFLRSDPQLAQSMGLSDLPEDDTQALMQTVAVLAQIDNIKRLWGVLKDRCETDKRTATDNERALLQVALSWHNHNWRSLPYGLIEIDTASRYRYETQLRSHYVTKGETVVATHLPGIVDGKGNVLCKALVQTK